MEIKELKTKIKIKFPEEAEIFMAEEFLEAVQGVSLAEKPVELDMSGVRTLDTVFLQLAVSIIKSTKKHNNKVTLKTGETAGETAALYGLDLAALCGGD